MQSEAKTKSHFDLISRYDHEQIIYCNDNETGLKSIIAIHDTTLGPALGGTRFWNYASDQEALYDVLRLSRGMTYKAAISNVNLGGGKAVIIGEPGKLKSEHFWRRYGKFINDLNGKYITAEDVGTTMSDMEYVSMETEFVTGKPSYLGGGGDPSPVTAYGTYLGLKACVSKLYGSDSLTGKSILVEGLGQVGSYLIERLAKEDARIYVSEINETRIKQISSNYKVTVVNMDEAYDLDIDIYAPCALGSTLNTRNINKLKCAIVAGAANNQLADEREHGQLLKEKGILYAPDFLINAGGIINCYVELVGYSQKRAYALTEKIYDRMLQIIEMAENMHIDTHEAALRKARERIDAIGTLNKKL